MFGRMKRLVPGGIRLHVNLFRLPVESDYTEITFTPQLAIRHTTLKVSQHLIHLIPPFAGRNKCPDSALQDMAAEDGNHIAMFGEQLLPDSGSVVHGSSGFLANAVCLRAPPVFPVEQGAVTI